MKIDEWAPIQGKRHLDQVCDGTIEDDTSLQLPGSVDLQRAAHLINSIVCPLGSADTHVSQDQTLALRDGTMTYMSVDCIKGVPIVRGEFVVRTIVQVTSKEGNPEAVRVRVAVNIGEIKLPTMFRWLQGRVKHSIRSDVVKQADKWLKLMVETEGGNKKHR